MGNTPKCWYLQATWTVLVTPRQWTALLIERGYTHSQSERVSRISALSMIIGYYSESNANTAVVLQNTPCQWNGQGTLAWHSMGTKEVTVKSSATMLLLPSIRLVYDVVATSPSINRCCSQINCIARSPLIWTRTVRLIQLFAQRHFDEQKRIFVHLTWLLNGGGTLELDPLFCQWSWMDGAHNK